MSRSSLSISKRAEDSSGKPLKLPSPLLAEANLSRVPEFACAETDLAVPRPVNPAPGLVRLCHIVVAYVSPESIT